MGEAIIARRGGGDAKITFTAYTPTNIFAIYSASGMLVRSTPNVLSAARNYLAATSIGDYALFGGGTPSGTAVDAYDTSLTRSTPTALSEARRYLAATSIGEYALFGGGYTGANSAVVDAYRPEATGFYQHMPIGTVFDFGTEITATAKENFIVTPATGWIKYKKGDL